MIRKSNCVEPKQMLYWNKTVSAKSGYTRQVEPKQMLYWNPTAKTVVIVDVSVEPKQMLYWNLFKIKAINNLYRVEPKQMLYWNKSIWLNKEVKALSNRNKCCIEILPQTKQFLQLHSRTETNVVLKSKTII